MKKDIWLYLLAAGLGAVIWILIAGAAGRREAWDSGMYFTVGIPVVCALSFVFGFFQPIRSWRWGVAPFAGQLVWMILTQGIGVFLPVGIVLLVVLSLPAMVSAKLGALLTTRKRI